MNNSITNNETDVCVRMVKSAKLCRTLTRIVQICVCVAMAASLVVLVTLIARPDMVSFDNVALNVPGVTINAATCPARTMVFYGMAYALPALGIFLAALFVLGGMFGDVVERETPFTESNVRRIKTLALLYITARVIPPLCTGVLYLILREGKLAINLELGVTLIVAIVLWTIARMFEYGAKLQLQDDETL